MVPNLKIAFLWVSVCIYVPRRWGKPKNVWKILLMIFSKWQNSGYF